LAAASSSPAAKSASLVIRHQQRGCHASSLNGGKFAVNQNVHLARGGFLSVTNNDLMAQELMKTRGPAVKRQLLGSNHMSQVMKGDHMGKPGPYTMSHMGARLKVSFSKVGVYHFLLMDRGDYMEVETVGPDNELALTVVVS